MESELDRTEDKLQEVSHRLELCEKARDDAELNLRSLENAEQSNFDRLDYQERALKDAQQIANESDRKYEGEFVEFYCSIKMIFRGGKKISSSRK